MKTTNGICVGCYVGGKREGGGLCGARDVGWRNGRLTSRPRSDLWRVRGKPFMTSTGRGAVRNRKSWNAW